MKLKFKNQAYQADSVQAIVDCFLGQPTVTGFKYAIDPGREAASGLVALPGTEAEGFANASLVISPATVLTNLQEVQRRQILPVSPSLVVTPVSKLNVAVFGQYKRNPEDFILKAGRLINEQKATVTIELVN